MKNLVDRLEIVVVVFVASAIVAPSLFVVVIDLTQPIPELRPVESVVKAEWLKPLNGGSGGYVDL